MGDGREQGICWADERELKRSSQLVAGGRAGGGRVIVDPDTLPGFPVRTVMDMAAQTMKLPGGQVVPMKTVKDVTAIKEEKHGASVFEAPKDCKVTDAAVLPGALQP